MRAWIGMGAVLAMGGCVQLLGDDFSIGRPFPGGGGQGGMGGASSSTGATAGAGGDGGEAGSGGQPLACDVGEPTAPAAQMSCQWRLDSNMMPHGDLKIVHSLQGESPPRFYHFGIDSARHQAGFRVAARKGSTIYSMRTADLFPSSSVVDSFEGENLAGVHAIDGFFTATAYFEQSTGEPRLALRVVNEANQSVATKILTEPGALAGEPIADLGAIVRGAPGGSDGLSSARAIVLVPGASLADYGAYFLHYETSPAALQPVIPAGGNLDWNAVYPLTFTQLDGENHYLAGVGPGIGGATHPRHYVFGDVLASPPQASRTLEDMSVFLEPHESNADCVRVAAIVRSSSSYDMHLTVIDKSLITSFGIPELGPVDADVLTVAIDQLAFGPAGDSLALFGRRVATSDTLALYILHRGGTVQANVDLPFPVGSPIAPGGMALSSTIAFRHPQAFPVTGGEIDVMWVHRYTDAAGPYDVMHHGVIDCHPM